MMYKKATMIYFITQGIQPIVYNNIYKWSIAFKNYEILYCTTVTYSIVSELQFSLKKRLCSYCLAISLFTCSGGNQWPLWGLENTQADLCRCPHVRELRHLATGQHCLAGHVNESSWKQILQSKSNFAMHLLMTS